MSEVAEPTNMDLFKARIEAFETGPDYKPPVAFALGLATVEGEGNDRQVIDVQYTRRNYEASAGTALVLAQSLGQAEDGLQTGDYRLKQSQVSEALRWFGPLLDEPGHPNIDTLKHMRSTHGEVHSPRGAGVSNRRVPVLGVVRDWDDEPTSVADTYLRLYAMSDRHKEPNTINLDGIFKFLPNVVITEELGTFTPERWDEVAEQAAFRGLSTAVRILDKFPRMTDHVVPSGVRIADPSRVRLGAHLGEGTTVMHEGFSNFNAGTLGTSMVEGRISQGVVVGKDSDIGGGASTQGTLSGGGKEKVSIGERCLVEANAGVGISLGDDCRVEAGFYVKSTTPVRMPDGNVVKASVLSAQSNMLIRRNAQSGEVEMVPNGGGEWGGLNTDLHDNN